MKSFLNFITEARESQASIRAKKLGLIGDGHGSWLDRSGKLVARTDNGQLKFLDAKEIAKDKAAKTGQQPQAANVPMPQSQPRQSKAPLPLPKDTTPKEKETDNKILTLVFGRFNPPNIGHEKTFNLAKKVAVGGDLKIYPSRIQDPKKNPLDPDVKVSFMRKMFPDYDDNIVNDPDMETIFDVLTTAEHEGYTDINIVCGSDRQSEFENLAKKHNGDLYNFESIRVIASGIRDDEASASSAISASKMRKAVLDNEFKIFRKGTPKTLNDGETQSLFDAVRQGMDVKKTGVKKESYNLWEIDPDQDIANLRENYVKGNIFKIGEKVQSLNTGLVGEVIRRGTNHLIYVTEEGYMFKSWIKDIMEYNENSIMRDKQHPNTLVGTLGAFKYFASMTPGAIGTGSKNIQHKGKPYGTNFINKYRKIKESTYSNV